MYEFIWIRYETVVYMFHGCIRVCRPQVSTGYIIINFFKKLNCSDEGRYGMYAYWMCFGDPCGGLGTFILQ